MMICTDEITGEEICSTKHKNKSMKIKTFMIDEFESPVSADKSGTVLSVNDSGKITYLTASELLSEIEAGGLDEKFKALEEQITTVDERVTTEVNTLNETVTNAVETLDTKISTLDDKVTSDVSTINGQISSLQAADETLSDAITSLKTREEEDITDVETRLDSIDTALSEEVTRATNAETELSNTKADKTEIKDGTLTIVLNGEELGTFSANEGEDKTIEITSSAAIMRFWDDE